MEAIYSTAYWALSDAVGGAKGAFAAFVILCVLLGLVRFVRYQFNQ
jgi:hypothetical protein